MRIAVVVFGAVVVGLSLFGLISPSRLLALVNARLWSRGGLFFAVGMRVVLGVLLLAVAPESRFPQTFRILGVLSLTAAAILPIFGLVRLRRLVEWWSKQSPVFVRGWLLLGVAFGGYLIYGVL